MKVALLFGATGLSGTALLEVLLNDTRYSEVRIFNRKPMGMRHAKLKEVIVDFSQLEQVREHIMGDVVFCCLGTTLNKAGSKEAQVIIDRDYPMAIAKIAVENGVQHFVGVSSVGTKPSTNNFYLKTKAEMEAGVVKHFGDRAFFMRPSFLLGKRAEMRIGEKIGIVIAKILNPLMIGSLKSYRGMPVSTLAKAMANIIFKRPMLHCLEYQDICEISR
jgi:uncharacterized protein YbjT (DUF2867 family)